MLRFSDCACPCLSTDGICADGISLRTIVVYESRRGTLAEVVFVDPKGSAVRGAEAGMVDTRAPRLIAALSNGRKGSL